VIFSVDAAAVDTEEARAAATDEGTGQPPHARADRCGVPLGGGGPACHPGGLGGQAVTELPLEGMLVLDFSQFLAGPSASLRLADLGARRGETVLALTHVYLVERRG
jgi:CoA-transferase family III